MCLQENEDLQDSVQELFLKITNKAALCVIASTMKKIFCNVQIAALRVFLSVLI